MLSMALPCRSPLRKIVEPVVCVAVGRLLVGLAVVAMLAEFVPRWVIGSYR